MLVIYRLLLAACTPSDRVLHRTDRTPLHRPRRIMTSRPRPFPPPHQVFFGEGGLSGSPGGVQTVVDHGTVSAQFSAHCREVRGRVTAR
jgi:hypothetical protein